MDNFKVKRGTWDLTVVERLKKTYEAPAAAPAVQHNLVPVLTVSLFPLATSLILKRSSSLRFSILHSSLVSGNGKTFGVEQACASLGRELIRVNITIETDEDDLIGGFRLVDGNTVWHNGPVVEALQRGAVLLLDEIVASNKILVSVHP